MPAPMQPADVERVDQLVAQLATGMERLPAQYEREIPESVDFMAEVLPNTCAGRKQLSLKKN